MSNETGAVNGRASLKHGKQTSQPSDYGKLMRGTPKGKQNTTILDDIRFQMRIDMRFALKFLELLTVMPAQQLRYGVPGPVQVSSSLAAKSHEFMSLVQD